MKGRRPSESSAPRIASQIDSLEPRVLLAYPSVVQDINQTTDMLGPADLTALGSYAYFGGRGIDGEGTELWRTDGTTAGTVLIKEIMPGLAGSSPDNFTDVGGTVFFTAADGVAGYELWKTDGTTAGTVRVKDIRPGAADSSPKYLTAVGNTLFFSADDGTGGIELWKSDGTDAGTVRVKDVYAGSTGSDPQYLVNYNGTLLFAAAEFGNGRELWRSDGTAAGTSRVADINSGGLGSTPKFLVPFNNAIYFTADPGSGLSSSRGDLYRTDGTAAGTVRVADVAYPSSGSDYSTFANITPSGDRLYFLAGSSNVNKYDLWGSDGTTAGTVKLISGTPFRNFDVIAPAGQHSLAFTYFTAATGTEVWISDGTAATTRLLKDVVPGAASGMSGGTFGRLGNTLYFAPNRMDGLTELWRSDLTTAGTVRVTNVEPAGLAIGPLVTFGDKLLFNGFRVFDQGDLFVSDGTAAGTRRLPATSAGNASGMKDYGLSPAIFRSGETMYFAANDGVTGREVWRTRAGAEPGTLGGASLVTDLAPFGGSSDPDYFAAGNDGSVYFTATTPATGTELFRIPPGDGAGAGLVSDFLPGVDPSYAKVIGALGDWVYIAATDAAGVKSLWRYNPAAGAPVKVTTPDGTAMTRVGTTATRAGGYLYFAADGLPKYGASSGLELWRTSGASNTAELVKDVNNGSDSFPNRLTAVGNTLYFTAADTDGGTELWRSDGTDAGTERVVDLTPGSTSTSISEIFALDGIVYFTARPGTTGAADHLWRTDGTGAGTYEVSTLDTARRMTGVGGQLYFVASDAQGRAVFRYDPANPAVAPARLTPATTGAFALVPTALYAAGGRVFIVATAGTGRGDHVELWQTYGTPAGTSKVRDLQPITPAGTFPGLAGYWTLGQYALAANSSRLFFPSWTPERGQELYSLPLTDPAGGIRGAVFDDRDRDGTRDAGEPGVAGRTVFVDFDNDGTPDADEPVATTDAAGNYALFALEANTYLVRQIVPDGWQPTGPASPRSVTVAAAPVDGVAFGTTDVVAPTIVSGAAAAERPSRAVGVVFSEDVGSSLAAGDFRLENLTTSTTVDAAKVAVSFDPGTLVATFTFPGYPGGALPDGNYRATVLAAGIADATGNAAGANLVFDFFVLAGDATRDRMVNFDDLLALAKNYNGTGKTWAQGDFTGDGLVNFDDLLVLAKNYNKTLPATGPASPAAPLDAKALAAAMGIAVPTTTTPAKPTPPPAPARKPPVTSRPAPKPAPVVRATAPTPAAPKAPPASVLRDDDKAKPVFSTTRVATPAPAPVKPKVAAKANAR
jgi:ELWxxDGT repeat protein